MLSTTFHISYARSLSFISVQFAAGKPSVLSSCPILSDTMIVDFGLFSRCRLKKMVVKIDMASKLPDFFVALLDSRTSVISKFISIAYFALPMLTSSQP